MLFLATACWAAPPVDLSGNWRFHSGDNVKAMAPDFDDRGWPVVSLPFAFAEEPEAPYWLRRTARLDGTFEHPTVTFGSLAAAYEVFVDGVKVAAVEGPRTRPYQPLAFTLRRGTGPTVSIAVRVRQTLVGRNLAGHLRDEGPYLLTEQWHADEAVVRSQLARQRAITPSVLGAYTELLFGALLLFYWLTGERRPEFLWWSLFLLLGAGANLAQFLQVYNGTTLPYPALPVIIAWGCLNQTLGLLFGRRHSLAWSAGFCVFSLVPGAPVWLPLAPAAVWSIPACLRGVREQRWLGIAVWCYVAPVIGSMLFGGATIQTYAGPFQIFISPWLSAAFGGAVVGLLWRKAGVDRRETERLSGELEAARTVQHLLLPTAAAHSDAYAAEAVYEPAQEVGGDFYWHCFDAHGSFLVVVGDVSGKGLKAAMLVSVAVGVLRNEKSTAPGTVLAALNEGLVGHTGGGFVTCCCARFDADGAVTIANAGHPSPYCDGCEVEVEAGLPLGVVAGVEYAESVVRGERFTFVSDGVVEAANPKGELFGFDRTAAISTESAAEIAEAARAWGQNDDITVVTVRRSA